MALITETNRKWWTLAAVTFSLFMIMLDVTIVNVALPAIQADFKVKLSQLEWTVNAYTLTYAVLLLTGGKLADLTGRRLIFVIGLISFSAASFVCAIAPSVDVLIAARAVQGVGAALMLPATLSIISASFPPQERGSAIGIWSAVSGIGLAIGPLVGGLLVEWLSWRWIFYINVPIGVIGFIAALLIIRESRDSSENQGLDVPGLVTSGVALFALTYGLIEGNAYGWTSQRILITLGVFVVSLVAFLVIESVSRAPMLNLALFRSGTFAGANTVGLLVFLAIVGLLFFVSIYLQVVLGFSPIQTGASFLPLTLMIIVASPIGGKITDRFSARWPMAVGMVLLTVMLLLMSRAATTDARFLDFLPALLIGGFGFGLVVPPMTTAVLSTVDSRLAGIASGVLSSFRQTGSALGVAVMGAIVAHEQGALTPRDAGFAHAFVTGFKDSLLLAAACTFAGALISAFFVRREDAVAAVVVDAEPVQRRDVATQVPPRVPPVHSAQTQTASPLPLVSTNGRAAERLGCLAAASALQGDLGRAVRLWGAAESVRRTIGADPSPIETALLDAYRDNVRTALGDERFDAEWAEGRDLQETLVVAVGSLAVELGDRSAAEASADDGYDHAEIGFRGTTSYEFYAWDVAAGEERGASSAFRWELSEPPDETEASRRIHAALVETLVASGWEVEGHGSSWYTTRLRKPRLEGDGWQQPELPDIGAAERRVTAGPVAAEPIPLAPRTESTERAGVAPDPPAPVRD